MALDTRPLVLLVLNVLEKLHSNGRPLNLSLGRGGTCHPLTFLVFKRVETARWYSGEVREVWPPRDCGSVFLSNGLDSPSRFDRSQYHVCQLPRLVGWTGKDWAFREEYDAIGNIQMLYIRPMECSTYMQPLTNQLA